MAELKAEGKVRHMGISFHDKPAVLERILLEHPEIEVVQIQLNYADYGDPIIERGGVYEVYGTYVHYTAKYGKASDCIGCGQCEQACPQCLPVKKLLKEIAAVYDHHEKKEEGAQ